PLNNAVWGNANINGEIWDLCPLGATMKNLDGRTTNGHVDNYWIKYESNEPDPYITNGWQQHEYLGNSNGFTFADYKQEIDAGRPVMIHLAGHSMTGVGYDNDSQTIYFHNTWDYDVHSMAWAGEYTGMQMFSVSVLKPGLTKVAQNIALVIGWNIISANVLPANLNLLDLFQILIGNNQLNKVMDESGNAIENFGAFGGWKNNIGVMLPEKGYKVNVTSNCTLNIP
ncbi:MAG: C39 family peptidase, partial [Bacteroidota bacterium]|nr:C39 family peptidase [Bacteroidota bacterium]